MFNSTVLEVCIGLIFTFASVSLIVSSLKEALSTLLGWRANTLLDGIKSLVNDPHFTGLARDLYNHALVNPRSNGEARTTDELSSMPSYIEPQHFASALLESIQKGQTAGQDISHSISLIENTQIKTLLEGIYQRTEGKIDAIQTQLGVWFDTGMDRVSGEYKRRSHYACLMLGLIIAAILNIDAFQLFSVLWKHPTHLAELTAIATLDQSVHPTTLTTLTQLETLPIGWNQMPSLEEVISHLPGWCVTASSTLFGAPFWFDMLQKITQLRGSGKKPALASTPITQ